MILHSKYKIVTDKGFARYEDQQIKMILQLVELFKNGPQDLSITNKQRQWLEVELREWLFLYRHLVGELSSGGNDAVNDVLYWLASYRQCQYCKKTKPTSEFEVSAAIEIHTYRLAWLKVKLSGYKRYCQQSSGEGWTGPSLHEHLNNFVISGSRIWVVVINHPIRVRHL